MKKYSFGLFIISTLLHIQSIKLALPSPDSLYEAAIYDDTSTLKNLIEHKENINQFCGTPQHTPLYWAAAFGNLNFVRTLLEAGADPDLISIQDTKTPLFIAAITGYAAIVKLLLEYHAKSHIVYQGAPEEHRQLEQTALQEAKKQRDLLYCYAQISSELYEGAIVAINQVIEILEQHEKSMQDSSHE
jgi:ankyrin repeat protein